MAERNVNASDTWSSVTGRFTKDKQGNNQHCLPQVTNKLHIHLHFALPVFPHGKYEKRTLDILQKEEQ